MSASGVTPQRAVNSISPFDEARLHPFNARGSTASNTPNQPTFSGFGQAQNIAASLQSQKPATDNNQVTQKLNEIEQSPFQTFSREDTYDYSAYIRKCCEEFRLSHKYADNRFLRILSLDFHNSLGYINIFQT